MISAPIIQWWRQYFDVIIQRGPEGQLSIHPRIPSANHNTYCNTESSLQSTKYICKYYFTTVFINLNHFSECAELLFRIFVRQRSNGCVSGNSAPQASLSVLTGKEGTVTMVTGLRTVWPTSWECVTTAGWQLT